MDKDWLAHWDNRYKQPEFAFGTVPNEYLARQLANETPGKILFAAEGEGRNAVHAAKSGWSVSAFDISNEGKNKAIVLSKMNDVTIDYRVGELPTLGYCEEQFDAIALIYAHFPAGIKSAYHKLLSTYVRKGGLVIFEAFSKSHLDYRLRNEKVGGPKDLESLFSIAEIRRDFVNYDVLEAIETEVELSEGIYHRGTGSVIRFTGRKS